MKSFLYFLVFFIPSISYANIAAVTENDPLTLVEGVSVITGDFYSEKEDILIQGAQQIRVGRSYISQKGKGAWNFLSYHQIYMDWDLKLVEVTEPGGAILLYEGTRSEEA